VTKAFDKLIDQKCEDLKYKKAKLSQLGNQMEEMKMRMLKMENKVVVYTGAHS
jgi:hypothetical protein